MKITIEKEKDMAKVTIVFDDEEGMAVKEYKDNLELYSDMIQMLPVLLEKE